MIAEKIPTPALTIECYELYKQLVFLSEPGYSLSKEETHFIDGFNALLKNEAIFPPNLMSTILNEDYTVEILGIRGKFLPIGTLRTLLHKLQNHQANKVKVKSIFIELINNPYCAEESGLFNTVMRLARKYTGVHSSEFTELLLEITKEHYVISTQVLLDLWFNKKDGLSEDPVLKNTGNVLIKTMAKLNSNFRKNAY